MKKRELQYLKFVLKISILLVSIDSVNAKNFPEKSWESRTPSELGMSAKKLKRAADYIGGNGCIIKDGYLIYGWGKYTEPSDIASAAKPFYTHFLFKAIEDTKISSIDEPIAQYEKRLNVLNPNLGYKDKFITWRHLATQTACYGVSEKPGTAFVYNDWQMALFVDILFKQVYKTEVSEWDNKILHPLLTDLIECQDNPSLLAFGTNNRPGRIAISPRDFARFGLLYMNQGVWNKNQIIGQGFAKLAITDPLPNTIPRTSGVEAEMIKGQRTMGSQVIPDNQCEHKGSYSWLWWINGIDSNGKRNWPDAPFDTFAALGHGGKEALIVIPSYNLILSWNQSSIETDEKQNQSMKLVIQSINHLVSIQGITSDKNNRAHLIRRNGLPFFICGPGDPEDFLYRGKENPNGTRNGDQMQLIKKLAINGGNCIYMIGIRSHGGDGDPSQNPFMDHNPNKQLNEEILNQWESWFEEMDKNDILIFFIFYDDSTCIWNTGDEVCAQEKTFFENIVNRFKKFDNLIWCIAEEYQEVYTAKRISKLASIIRRCDEFKHPIAVHSLDGIIDFGILGDDQNIDQFAIQYNVKSATELHNGMVKAWNLARKRYNINMSESAGFGTGESARKKCWACAMAGANVMVLDMDIANTPLSDLEDCRNLIRFMKFTNFNQMIPSDELASDATDYVLSSGKDFILYSKDSSKPMGIKRINPGTYELAWFDCINGRWTIEPHVRVFKTKTKFEIPCTLGKEVALYLRNEQKK